MPHDHNADRRHNIPKMSFKVQNWPEYEAGLRRRGGLTRWNEDAALGRWPTREPGGPSRYPDAAIRTSWMLRAAFKLPLRQTEGLLASVRTVMELTIAARDHATLSRRAVNLPVIQTALVAHGRRRANVARARALLAVAPEPAPARRPNRRTHGRPVPAAAGA